MAGTLLNGSFDKTNANDQLNATLNKGGLLMRMAGSKGQQAAGGRGLMNSSIGSEASMRAMVDAATPIAQQNAQFEQTKDINQQQSDLTAKRDETLQGYQQANTQQQATLQSERDRLLHQQQLGTISAEGAQRLKEMDVQYGYNTQLQNDQQDFAAGQSALDRTQQTNLTNLQFQNQTSLNNQQNQFTSQRDATLFGYDQRSKATDFENQLKTMSEQQRNDLAKLNAQTAATKDINAQQQQFNLTNTAKQVAANTQGMYLEAINGLTSTFGDQVAAIQSSALNAADKTTAVNSLINSQNAMLKFYQNTYQNMSTIKDDWINVDVNTLPSGSISNVK